MKKIVLIILGIVISSCSVFSYKYNPREDRLDCDSGQPLEQLLQCIEDKYEMINTWSFGRDARWVASYKYLTSAQNKFLDKHKFFYRRLEGKLVKTDKKLPNLNKCRYARICNNQKLTRYYNGPLLGKGYKGVVDYYKGRYVGSRFDSSSPVITYDSPGRAPWTSFGGQFTSPTLSRSANLYKNDVILAEMNKKSIIYFLTAEAVRLKDNKDLIGIHLCRASPLKLERYKYKLEKTSTNIPVYRMQEDIAWARFFYEKELYKIYEPSGCYKFWVFDNLEKTEANLALSLNRRVNPTTAYIRLGEHTYELDLTTAPL
ncbi:MAG: hypothetical protein KHX61_06245 [Proteobacteria bacterium]|nr:hypothetical protein [Pseudomonadota bacterium]